MFKLTVRKSCVTMDIPIRKTSSDEAVLSNHPAGHVKTDHRREICLAHPHKVNIAV